MRHFVPSIGSSLLGAFAALVLLSAEPQCQSDDGAPSGTALERVRGMLPGMEPEAGESDLRETPIVRAVRRAKDSVVNVFLTRDVPARFGGGARVDGAGSGVILDATGFVITNWHVVLGALSGQGNVVCKLNDGTEYPARVLTSSAEHDLALLQLELPENVRVQPVALADSDTLMIGETVIAIGNPQGRSNSVTAGVLSATDRTIQVRTPDGVGREYRGLLQTDAAINQGNSGGALLDITGRLIGINNAMQRNVENIGFAIPVNTMRQVFEEVLLSSDNLQNAWLGMSVEFSDAGHAIIKQVAPAGPAARAGLRPGDIVQRIGRVDVDGKKSYVRATATLKPGRRTALAVLRGRRSLTPELVPMSRAQYSVWQRIGVLFEEVNPRQDYDLVEKVSIAFAREMRIRPRLLPTVVRVTEIQPEGPAAEIGLKRDDVLIGFQHQSAFFGPRVAVSQTIRDLAEQLDDLSGRNAAILVHRGDNVLEGRIFVRRP